MSGRQYCYISFFEFPGMEIPHIGVFCQEEPSRFIAEPNYLWIKNVIALPIIRIAKPFREPLDCESSGSEPCCYRFSRETVIKKQNAFLTPLFDVHQGELSPFQWSPHQEKNLLQFPLE